MGDTHQAEAFIARWSGVTGSERANYQPFITELCGLLDLPLPEPAHQDTRDNAYVFERRVTFAHGDGSESNGFIDCYRRSAFVLEAKKVKAGLVALNARRAAEEAAGTVRWLRPPSQPPYRSAPGPRAWPSRSRPWPNCWPPARMTCRWPTWRPRFTARGRWRERLPTIIDTLEALGRARRLEGPALRWQAA